MAKGAFTEEELGKLKENYDIRKKLVDELLQTPAEMSATKINNILDSMDKSIQTEASLRIKERETKIDEKMLDTVSAALKIIHMETTQPRDLELKDDEDIVINSLEMATEPESIDIDGLYKKEDIDTEGLIIEDEEEEDGKD